MKFGANAAAWDRIDPGCGDVIPFRTTETDDDKTMQVRCKFIQLQLVYMDGLHGRMPHLVH